MSRPLSIQGDVQQLMVRVPMAMYEAMLENTYRDGIPMAEQIRRAIGAYLEMPAAGPRARKPVSLKPKHAGSR